MSSEILNDVGSDISISDGTALNSDHTLNFISNDSSSGLLEPNRKNLRVVIETNTNYKKRLKPLLCSSSSLGVVSDMLGSQ